MAETIVEQAQAASVVETALPTPEIVDATPLETPVDIARQMTLASIAQDHQEVARLEQLLGTSKAPAKVEEVVHPTAEETAAKEVEVAKVEVETQAEESGELPTTKEPNRFRFSSPEDKAIALMAKSKGISLAAAAKIYEGEQPKAQQQETVQTQQVQIDPTITAIEAEVEAIKQEFRATYKADAMDENLPEIQIRLSEANARLITERRAAKTLADVRTISKQERAAENQAAFDVQVSAIKAETAKAFPALADPKSPLVTLADGIAKQMEDPAHPDHQELYKPTVVRFLAEKAAKLLNIAPVGEPAPVTPPAKTVAKEVARPAAGSRASSIPAPQQTAEQVIAALKEKALTSIAGGHFNRQGLAGTIIL